MNTKSFKIGVPAALAAMVIVMVMVWTIGGNPKIALANVLNQLQGKSYEFVMEMKGDKEPLIYQCMVMEPGKMRASGGTPDFGTTSVIMDGDRILLLLDKMKWAMVIDKKTAMKLDQRARMDPAESGEAFTIYTLLERSITNLWNLQDESGKKLERKKIDGVESEGFFITQKIGVGISQEITLWADAKTAFPTRIEIIVQRENQKEAPTSMVLKNFKIIEKPDASLFALKAPKGYLLSGYQTLQDLADSRKDLKTTPEAQKIVIAMNLWKEDKKDQALESLLSADWKKDLKFSFENYVFTVSEDDYASLVEADRNKVDLYTQLDYLREMARELQSRAQKARDAKEYALAERYLDVIEQMSEPCKGEGKSLPVEMVSIAFRAMAAKEKVALYEAMGDATKAEESKKQVKQAEVDIEAMKKRVKERTPE